MPIHPCANQLIVGVDEKFLETTSPDDVEDQALRLLSEVCENLTDTGIQLKLNTVSRVLGYKKVLTMIQEAGLTAMIDMKLIDVVDTMLSDIRAIRHFDCL